ncbi:MAG: CRISPR-associated helicase Cas3' [Peptostreptococcaceae bacterium]|nr:CRISPR-associated helicase Cas3' [Peptostreptococcaceae bacterium]
MEDYGEMIIAHIRLSDSAEGEDMLKSDREQELKDHLLAVSEYAGTFSQKIGLENCGRIVGLLHDIGKASKAFQEYIRGSAYSGKVLHKVDHATAGARLLYDYFYRDLLEEEKNAGGAEDLHHKSTDENVAKNKLRLRRRILEILKNVIISHHSGLYSYYSFNEPAILERRLLKDEKEMFLEEAKEYLFSQVLSKKELDDWIEKAYAEFEQFFEKDNMRLEMTASFVTKFLFSCLIDADRLDSFLFEENSSFEKIFSKSDNSRDLWERAHQELLQNLEKLKTKSGKLDRYRQEISDTAEDRAKEMDTGIVTLNIPTGAGKTLTAMRFALRHAMMTGKTKIIYITNYLTVIEQNAEVIRKTLPSLKENILEFHSNVVNSNERAGEWSKDDNEAYNWKTKQNGLLQERWESPVIFTSVVQFMNTFFEGKNAYRKLHQLADSVIIFDEAQSLPMQTVLLFCQALNFLKQINTTAILCTATQPDYQIMEDGLDISDPLCQEIIPEASDYFEAFRRNEIYYPKKTFKDQEEVSGFLLECLQNCDSLLMITNTVRSARSIFLKMKEHQEYDFFYLSTALCPAHRKAIIKKLRERLQEVREGNSTKKVICISTPVIEAGVDISFGMVVRSVSGLDSIAQAAGRCNREKEREVGEVHIIKLSDEMESLSSLTEIELKQKIAKGILRGKFDPNDILSPKTLQDYFKRLHRKQVNDYKFRIDLKDSGGNILFKDSSIYDILSSNQVARNNLLNGNTGKSQVEWVNSSDIRTAEKEFYVIKQKGKQVLVPYTDGSVDGKEIINALYSQSTSITEKYHILRKAQQITISLFDNVFLKLVNQKMITAVPEMEGLYVLNESLYSTDSGFVGLDNGGEITYLDI